MRLHGSRLLGLVRAGAYALYGRDAPFPVSGTDQVYGLNVARFLADDDEPDELVLSLYGQLAAAMTPGTFVAGEAASCADPRRVPRAMYLPPNGASNATFLDTLRLLLVHETVDARRSGRAGARVLDAARVARAGQADRRAAAPTSFGPVSFAIQATRSAIGATIDVPPSAPRNLRAPAPAATRLSDHQRPARRPAVRAFRRPHGHDRASGGPGRIRLVADINRQK